ncbi:hypothetical protein VNI00_019241 [Paramarasmius palmivorus]|uniref:Aminoglycoside phosphotransferase domain-containing protein n=1 Tax=Paramarasmius palmivorus TaxID=297713 RepID=A0AAW0AQS0_9AGAR
MAAIPTQAPQLTEESIPPTSQTFTSTQRRFPSNSIHKSSLALPQGSMVRIPPQMMEDCSKLILAASAIFRENEDRTRELHDIYETVLDCEIIQRCVGHSTLEGCITVMLEDDETCVAALRQQNERGSENGDVNVRISAEYKRYWLGETTTAVRSRTRCPTLLLTFQGPLLTVSGAILTDRWIVQTLATCSVSRVSSLDAAHQLKVTQIFHACRLAISELKTFYRSIDLTSALTTWRPYDHSRWFPAATTYRDDKGNEITFVYQRPMTAGSRCTTFLVEELKGKKLRVVKFSERYGDQVHRCLAEANLAPKLLYSGPPFIDGTSYDNVRMTVMDPVLGESLHKSKESLTPKHKEQLKQAVDLLGEKGFVHGDIRKPNVLIDGKSNIKIIDFEWAGEEGKVQFPVYLNSDEFMGAKAFDFIQHRHDVDLVERLLNEDPTGDQ